MLLAFGALAARRELARTEARALSKQAQIPGSESNGPPIDQLVQEADARYERLRQLLPPGFPDHWRLVCSQPLLGEYARKLHQTGPKLDPKLRPQDLEIARRQIEIVCADIIDDFDPTDVPCYTTDRSDDAIVHTALLANATWLIADDRKHISTDPDGPTEYRLTDSDRHVSAITFSRFLDHLTEVDLDHVDPDLIATAFALISDNLDVTPVGADENEAPE